jgi:hypothetical protein
VAQQCVRAGVGLAVRGLGGVAAAPGQAERAGVLCGASTNLLVASDPSLTEARGAALATERCVAEARERSASAEFASGWTSGVAMQSEVELMNFILGPMAPEPPPQ